MGIGSALCRLVGLVDAPEYKERLKRPFVPPKFTIQDVHAAVPKELHQKRPILGLLHMAKCIMFVSTFFKLAGYIEPTVDYVAETYNPSPAALFALKWSLWALYWTWQGFGFGSFFTLAHEAAHGALSNSRALNTFIGYPLHIFVLAPYHAWKASHNLHHKATGQMERDENYLPKSRSQYGLPAKGVAKTTDYLEMFEDAPLYTLGRMLFMQLAGLQLYFTFNLLGSPMYPAGTNHYNPYSKLFKEYERSGIVASDIGLTVMSCLLYAYFKPLGLAAFMKFYFIPYLLCNHWIVLLTYLHHSDPGIPHYRGKEWNYTRGAMATVDRPLLGWVGRVFFHNVSHDHIAHHFFSTTPFYNQPKVTEALKKLFGDEYNYDSTPVFRALYRSFTQCCFIEDEGDVIFYKNARGEQQRFLDAKAAKELGIEQ
jgi:omega-6 fatty acid desaturase (delta-12 desaturase)